MIVDCQWGPFHSEHQTNVWRIELIFLVENAHDGCLTVARYR